MPDAIARVIVRYLFNPFSFNGLRRPEPVSELRSAASVTLSNSPIVRDVLDNGLRILTERMREVRSVSIGVWLTRGSRHETAERGGIAHFVEHMLFKGTRHASAEDIAQAIDSIGGQLDAFTAKEYASYYIKVLDEHLPLALDILSDIVLEPGVRRPTTSSARRRWSSKRSRWSRTRPTISSTSSSRRGSGRTIRSGVRFSGTRETVESFNARLAARSTFATPTRRAT